MLKPHEIVTNEYIFTYNEDTGLGELSAGGRRIPLLEVQAKAFWESNESVRMLEIVRLFKAEEARSQGRARK